MSWGWPTGGPVDAAFVDGEIDDAFDAFHVAVLDTDVEIVADDTLNIYAFVPFSCTVIAIKLWFKTKAGSVAGTYLFTCAEGANNLLEPVNYDLETIVNETLTAMTLQSTAPANLDLDAGDVIKSSWVSDNADLTGGTGAYIQILVKRR